MYKFEYIQSCPNISMMYLLGFALLVISSQLNVGLAYSLQRTNKAGCAFNLDTSSPAFPPHLIDANQKIVLPVMEGTSRIINLSEGQQVTISCLGTGNYMTATGLQLNPATCAASSNLQLADGTEYSYAQTGCLKQNKEVLIEQGTCANGPGTFIRNGWQFGADFISLFDMCHDKNLALNYYTINTVFGKSANADDKANSRPSFSQSVYYPGLSVNTLYTQAEQTKTIAMIVGSDALAGQYIVPNTEYYLSRGHMAPDADFIDAASQDASYYFMNAAPQFQTFNNGNWKWLEIGVRNTALARQLDLTIYTGTFSVMTLADINGVQQEIYLTFDANNNGLIPAPKYFWKLIHEPISNTATAVIGINNPYLNPVMPEDIICPDVCDQIPWVTSAISQLTNIAKGYTFCCTAAELHKAVSFAPNLDLPLFI